MNKLLIKNYNKLFPNIDLSKGYLNFEDKKTIISYYLKDINYDNPKIIDMIDSLGSNIKASIKYKEDMALLLNPENKPGGSIRTIKYWISRGWTIEYAKNKVSEIQKINSPRSNLYWEARGLTKEEAIKKVSEIQSDSGKEFHRKLKLGSGTVSCWNVNFWVNKGYTLAEAIELVKEKQKSNNRKSTLKYTKDELKVFNPLNVEYWAKNYKDQNYVELFENYLSIRYSNSVFRSKIADEFCESLSEYFQESKLYFGTSEYGKYIPNVGYRKYDYIDLTNMVCIEFHGNYWHSENNENDLIKKKYIESLGFRYFVVWESDYNLNKTDTIIQLVKDIKNENS